MNAETAALETATIRQQCKVLRMPTIAAQCAPLAQQAVRERRTHLGYLEALLQAELEERDQRLIERRIREARLPRMKTLDEFDFVRNPKVSAQRIHQLASGDYITQAEPVIFIGDSGSIYLASPVFGRPDNAARRQLVICLSGPDEAKARVRPLHEAIGRAIYDFGPAPDAANVAKLAGNFLIGAAVEAMGEAFTLVEKSGVDRLKVAQMLTQTLFASPVYQNYGAMVAEKRHHPAGFQLALGLKDFELVLKTAGEVRTPMPLASLVRDRLLAALAKGRDDLDWSGLALGVLDDAGIK